MVEPLPLTGAALAVAGLIALVLGVRGFRGSRRLVGAVECLVGVLLLSLTATTAALWAGTRGYRALTREVVAATVRVEPLGDQAFRASFSFPDGSERSFELRGDQLYVDAEILKWKPLFNILGLHTGFELDRVGGRYAELDDERDAPRTVYSLGEERRVDLFALRRRFDFLAPLVDAEYGSGTFVPADRPVELEVRVSTSGLLVRSVPDPGARP